jgi:hypothetical protein
MLKLLKQSIIHIRKQKPITHSINKQITKPSPKFPVESPSCRTLAGGVRRRGDHRLISGFFCVKESPRSIMVTRKPNWSFKDSKARDWLRKGKVLAPLVRHT